MRKNIALLLFVVSIATGCIPIINSDTSGLMRQDEFIHLNGFASEVPISIARILRLEKAQEFHQHVSRIKRIISSRNIENKDRLERYRKELSHLKISLDLELKIDHEILNRIENEVYSLNEAEIKTLLSLHYTSINVQVSEAIWLNPILANIKNKKT